jgi:uncharacterized membrane protein
MSFCQTCGSNLPEGTAACPACGAVQGVAAPSAAPAGYPPPPPAGYPPPAAYAVAAPAANAGLSPNVAGALAYLVGLITGIVFLVLDPFKNDPFVKFHAYQSIFFNVAWIAFWIVWTIVGFVLGAVSHGLFFIISIPINLVLGFGGLFLWLYLMYTAYQGKIFKLPLVGPLAAKQAGIQ